MDFVFHLGVREYPYRNYRYVVVVCCLARKRQRLSEDVCLRVRAFAVVFCGRTLQYYHRRRIVYRKRPGCHRLVAPLVLYGYRCFVGSVGYLVFYRLYYSLPCSAELLRVRFLLYDSFGVRKHLSASRILEAYLYVCYFPVVRPLSCYRKAVADYRRCFRR